ncbi:hypothetical protein Tco_1064789 [Tanacetum coccineum]
MYKMTPHQLPTPSPPLLLPSIDHRADKPEVCLPPRKRLCIDLGSRYEVEESLSAPAARPTRGFRADYGAPATDETELGRRMTNLVTTVRQDTDKIYRRLDEAQEAKAVLSGRLNLLGRDRRSHAYTTLLMEKEARLSHGDYSLASGRLRSTGTAVETLRLMSTLQTQVTALQSQLGQQGPASGPTQPEIPEEAGSSS